ncbi:MAG: hypothetical protein JNM70_26835, partial [Anaerolineae bacterium]|nr:hypothetical protein [Anaerolineae bacterium]
VNTDSYLLLGLVVVSLVVGGYLGSLVLRFSSARKTIHVLEQLKDR